MQQAPREFDSLYRRVKENGGADADFQARAPTSHLQLLCVLGRCSAVPDAPPHTPQVHVELVPPLRQVPRGMCVRPASSPPVLGGEGACSHVYMNTPLALEVWATRDCYVYLVEQDAHGALCPLLPNNAVQSGADCRLRAHERRRVDNVLLELELFRFNDAMLSM